MAGRVYFLAVLILLVPLVLAYNFDIVIHSNFEDFNTEVYRCSNISCSDISFYTSSENGEYSLSGSGGDYYVEYDYRSCYRPHIYLLNAWGEKSGIETYEVFFSKKTG